MEISRMRYSKKPANEAGRPMSHKKGGIFILLILMIGSLSGYAVLAVIKPIPAVQAIQLFAANMPAQKETPLMWPAAGQASIGSLEQGFLESTAGQIPVPIASTAKVITALAVLEKKPIPLGSQGETIIISSPDTERYNYYLAMNGSTVAVANGEELTEYQALEAMLLPSANNMADSLVSWAFGSTDTYVAYARNMLSVIGAKQTVVSDASGFSAQTLSTAHDLVLIGQKALQNPVLKQIVAEKKAEIPVAGTIHNVNDLLGDENIIGIKTGNTDEAGGCLLFAATHAIDSLHTITIIGAITGAPDLKIAFQNTLTLLHSAETHFKAVTVLPEHSKIYTFHTAWGTSVDAYSTSALTIYGWADMHYTRIFKPKSITVPLTSGSEAGSVYVDTVGQHSTTEMITSGPFTLPPLIWRLKHYF